MIRTKFWATFVALTCCGSTVFAAVSIEDFQNSLPAGHFYVDLTAANTANADG